MKFWPTFLKKNKSRTVHLAVAVLMLVQAGAGAAAKPGQESKDDARVQELYAEAKSAQAAGNLATAAERYEAILVIAPRLAAAYNNLGSIYIQQREFRKAAEVLQKGLKINPAMPSASALLGIAQYEMGAYAEAEQRLAAALRTNPNDNNAELYLAHTLIQLGKLEQAASHLQSLSRREAKNQEVWYLLGKVYMQLSQESLAKLNEIDPDSYVVHQVSGEIMESMNNLDGALLEYKKAVDLAPDKAGTHYHLGNAYWSLAMWEQAEKELRAELAINPKNCQAHWKLGQIALEQRDDPHAAVDEEDKALSACPNLDAAREDRARALLKLERYKEAMADLQVVVAADPSEPRRHFLLAQAYRALGRAQEAQAEMRTFSKLQEDAQASKANRAKQILENKERAPTP